MNNLAVALASEDEKTCAKHIHDLQAKLKKAHPDLGVVADEMKRTASFRQSQCLESATAVVLESFPALHLHSFVSTPQSNKLYLFQQNFAKYSLICLLVLLYCWLGLYAI